MNKFVSIRGAREHNLQNIDVDLPRDKLVLITGLSGSGKSSLAFDTIYAEGQRRYVESLSAYARQFLEMMQKPDLDSIEGLSPAISIEQKTTSRNPRSTVGTVTEIYDYLRLLFARIGVAYSPATGLPIKSQSVSQMVDAILAMEKDTKLLLLAPIARGRKGEYRAEFASLAKQGFQRIRIDGTVYEMDELPQLNKNIKHDIEVVVDRIIVKTDDDLPKRLADSIETILKLSNGLLFVDHVVGDADSDDDKHKRQVFSANFSCPVSGFTIEEIEPRLFSFNSPHGACPTCDGLGVEVLFDKELVVPNPELSLARGAILPWSNQGNKPAPYYWQTLVAVGKYAGFDMDIPFGELTEQQQNIILFGTDEKIQFLYQNEDVKTYRVERPFEGVINSLMRRFRETDSASIREELAKYQSSANCTACGGYRLCEAARTIKINETHIGQVSEKSINDAYQWFTDLPDALTPTEREIATQILKEIRERLQFLMDVGLNYLTLSRKAGTLSSGESQRIRLASQIGSGLTGVLYVLDEPSIGLHQRDNDRLLTTLIKLRDLGNTVIVVEHDEDAMRIADYVLDIGPGAGIYGGHVVAEGTLQDIINCKESLTGQYLSGVKKINVPKERRKGKSGQKLKIQGARHNNLNDVTIEIPLSTLTCVTGVSGSGKSSLIIETLQRALASMLMGARDRSGEYDKISGTAFLDKIIVIDQSPIGRTPRSNPATYTGLFTYIRDWFASLPDAKMRGYKASRFSFNVKGGRCETCQGDGLLKIEMHFLPDVYIQCDNCKGKRYNRETLEVKYRDKSIADILNMSLAEALDFFRAIPNIHNKLQTLHAVGLDYIKLGQQATTLSGGEAQRIKLAKELSRRATGRTIYVLDEPTTGLHFADIQKLLDVLQRLVDTGNTVLVIEHNLDVIKTADWLIDVGPEGGDAGGNIIGMGTPEHIATLKESHTGRYLKEILKK
ncbi:MAG: excinuclease ABC subunit UvrA [Alphaproteobacteria bacterium]|nr:excinuclease ABC subunit UvrA [Alphaproteobacteria bacterium]